MADKLFCGDCEFFDSNFENLPEKACRKILVQEVTPTDVIESFADCNVVNRKNNCPNFQKRTWTIWQHIGKIIFNIHPARKTKPIVLDSLQYEHLKEKTAP